MLKNMTSLAFKIIGAGLAFSNVALSKLTGVNSTLSGEVGLEKLRLLMRILGEITLFLLFSRDKFFGDIGGFLYSFGLVLATFCNREFGVIDSGSFVAKFMSTTWLATV